MKRDKKLRILQVVPYFYPAWAYGGTPRVVYELSRELVESGHDVTVYTTDVLDQNSRNLFKGGRGAVDGIKVYYFRNLSNRCAYKYQMFIPMGLLSVVRQTVSEFDIIHLHGHRHFLNNIVHYYAVKSGRPYILSGHGTVLRIERRILAKLVFDKFFGQRVLNDAAHFVAVSENEVGQYEQMGVEKKQVTVVYNGIDLNPYKALPQKSSFRKKYNMEDSNKIILYLGKITPRKGIDVLVKAFAGLERDDTVLVIAGNDMGFKKTLVKILEQCSITDRVIFTGLIVGDEKLAAYQDADVLVYPAVYEIFGLVPFEALMCGTPVIVTDDCGCGEIIEREGIGYTVKYNNIKGLIDKIKEVLDNRGDSEQRVKKGKEFISNNLNWKTIGDKYVDVYRSAIK